MLLLPSNGNNTGHFEAKAQFKESHKGKIEIIWSNIIENGQQTESITICSNWT